MAQQMVNDTSQILEASKKRSRKIAAELNKASKDHRRLNSEVMKDL